MHPVCRSPELHFTLDLNWHPFAALNASLHWLSYIYNIELTVEFETNITLNAERKMDKHMLFTRDLSSRYVTVKVINLSISSQGIFGKSCNSLIDMCNNLILINNT